MSTDRWFPDEHLTEMARPIMDRAVEAIDAGDRETARAICKAHNGEWLMLHDLMAESVLGLVSFIQDVDDIPERHWRRYGAVKPSR